MSLPNPHSLPYGSNLGAPAIKPDHSLGGWKIGAVHRANKHYDERFNKLKPSLNYYMLNSHGMKLYLMQKCGLSL